MILFLLIHFTYAQRWHTFLPQLGVLHFSFDVIAYSLSILTIFRYLKLKIVTWTKSVTSIIKFNTGQVYAFTAPYQTITRLGPICFGSRNYQINRATNSTRSSKLGDKVCYENGFFRKANFVGTRKDYIS